MAAGESTPLLGSSSPPQSQDDETSPLLAAASAPPPVDAPPPVPEEESPLKDSNNGKLSWLNPKKQNNSPTTSIETAGGDTSESQLSLPQSKKQQRRSGTKKKRGGDALSNNSTSSTSKRSLKNKEDKTKKKKKQSSDGPQKTVPHFLFDIVRYLAIFASGAMLFMQILPIVVLDKDEITGLQYFVRVYLIIFCASFILLESRIPLLRRPAHDNWILRGFMYTFIGIIGMEQDVAIKVEDIASGTANILGPDYGTLFASLSIAITTWIMVGVGVLYMILGTMCLQKWYERLEKEYQDKVGEWKRKKKREKEIQKEKEEYVKYEKDRREGRGEWYDDLETGK
ncbi:hypothetical protein QTG54_015203 [Skeletonema marinoi]|uniref:Uncharacterized protein n=1 Tax=Skeletonema marinoi TaxID=267567 RepID=A0AAD8XVI4_9STRA|nr:hypothetical protein QTG54_015203 [Skeletonema marinoi]